MASRQFAGDSANLPYVAPSPAGFMTKPQPGASMLQSYAPQRPGFDSTKAIGNVSQGRPKGPGMQNYGRKKQHLTLQGIARRVRGAEPTSRFSPPAPNFRQPGAGPSPMWATGQTGTSTP